MERTLEEAKSILKKYNQEHILNGYDNLDENKKQVLLNQIFDTDFELIKSLYANTKKQLDNNDDKIEPMDYMDKLEKMQLNKESLLLLQWLVVKEQDLDIMDQKEHMI